MNRIPEKSKNLIEREVEEGLLLLRENGEYLVLNNSACFIWKNMDKCSDISGIINLLNENFEKNPPENAEELVTSFLSELKDSGYLVDKND